MIDSFEKDAKLHERRAARERQLRLMELAASGPSPFATCSTDAPPPSGGGVVLDTSGSTAGTAPDLLSGADDGLEGPPTMADISMANGGRFSIDNDDDEDAGPPSVFTVTDANDYLWKSTKTMKLDNEKLVFITGDESSSSARVLGGKSGWLGKRRENDEGRDLLVRASHRLSFPREETPKSGNISTFNIAPGGGEDGEADEFRRRSRIELPTCCLLHRRAISAAMMILMLAVIVLFVTEPRRRDAIKTNRVGPLSPPWGEHDPENESDFFDRRKWNRIKDRILEHGISHASTLEEPSSPQYKALIWLVRDDARQLDLPQRDDESTGMTGADVDLEQTLFQRYALAVLWYQTSDLRIVQQSMTGSDVEDPFDNPVDPLDYAPDDINWTHNTNWMTSKGLCLWHGVTCHPHDRYGEKYDGDFYVAILNLTDNNIHGLVPREVFTGFRKLKALDLSRNGFKGTIGRELGKLVDLEDLFLFENNFSGIIPDNIGNLRNMYNLYVNDNKFRGKLPSQIGDLTKLRGASMFNNQFEGSIPDSFGNLKNMIALYLDDNKFTGQVPMSIGEMTSMIDLRLRVNNLSGTIPTELGNLNNLETLYLDTNRKIRGPIPTELSRLEKMTELHLYEMSLNGYLPSELGLLEGLVYLYLDTNELNGSIPEEWGGMRDLEQLFLTGNELSGWLPVSIRGLRSLQMLRAADNELSGPIPSDLGKLTKLEYIYLEDNNFSGRVPSELGELTKLKLMHLHGSNLSGVMPLQVCRLQRDFSLRDLTADCQEITCACCTCGS